MAELSLWACDLHTGEPKNRKHHNDMKVEITAGYAHPDGEELQLRFSLKDDELCHAIFHIDGVEEITLLMAYCHTALSLHAGGHLE